MTTIHSYRIELEVSIRAAGKDVWLDLTINVPFKFTPNNDSLNPETVGGHDIDPQIYDAWIVSIDGLDVGSIPRAAVDAFTQVLLREALARNFHQGAMLDIARAL